MLLCTFLLCGLQLLLPAVADASSDVPVVSAWHEPSLHAVKMDLVDDAHEPRRHLQQSDSVTNRKSYFANVKESIGGFFIGILLIVMAFPVLTYNEGSYVHRLRAITWVKKDLQAQKEKKDHKSNLVYTSGPLSSSVPSLSLTDFGVTQENALRLRVKVEMFQNYVEVKQQSKDDRIGGGTTQTTTYNVKQDWADKVLDPNPSDPHSAATMTGEPNPSFPECLGLTRCEQKAIYINDFALSPFMIERLLDFTPVSPPASFLLPETTWQPAFRAPPYQQGEKYLYFPNSTRRGGHSGGFSTDQGPMLESGIGPARVGDIRVSFQVVRPATYSILAGLASGDVPMAHMFQKEAVQFDTISADKAQLDTFEVSAIGDFKVPPCCAIGCCKMLNKAGELANDIDLIVPGAKSEQEMIDLMVNVGEQKLKLLRIVGFLMFFVGCYLLFAPAVALVSLVGFIGNLLSVGVWLIALVFAFIMTMATVCLAWLYYRPLKALLLAAATTGLVYLISYLAGLGKDDVGTSTTAAPLATTTVL